MKHFILSVAMAASAAGLSFGFSPALYAQGGGAAATATATRAGAPAQADAQTALPTETELSRKLKAIPGVTQVVRVEGGRGGRRGGAAAGGGAPSESWDVTIEQPIDHTDPGKGKFSQHFYVTHAGYDKPVVLNTEGYAARGPEGTGEFGAMLGGPNSVTLEHRYFGRSVPSPLDWTYMNVKQAADDMHVVVSAMKKIYPGKWVATGTSKGGQTSLFYKCYYPHDVDATVAYVAPVNVQQEDPRINRFIETNGDEATRKKIKDFQIALFKHETELIELIKNPPAGAARGRGGRGGAATYAMGIDKAYEYGVLEYPYYFWQYGLKSEDIPPADAPVDQLLTALNKANTIYYYSDQGKKQFEPFLYEAMSEIGYYNYDITDFKQYMKALKNPTNLDICPDGAKVTYHPETMAFVYHYLQYEANNVAYIYGELDAWSATQMSLIGRTDAIKLVVKDSHHNARIGALNEDQKKDFYDHFDKWMGMKVNRGQAAQ